MKRSALILARSRRRVRAGERGAALFIVVLVVVLLTAIGAFAAHATGMSQSASGYSRRSASAFYLGEFAMNLVSADMAGKEQAYLLLALTGQNDCRATLGVVPPPGGVVACRAIEMAEIAKSLDSTITGDTDGPIFGALSRPDSPAEQAIKGGFRVEMTDLGPGLSAQAGMAMNGPAQTNIWQVAYTTTARIAPFTTGASDCSEDVSRASLTQSLRGYVAFTTLGTPPPGAL
jgi:hypothetical protein